MQKIKIIQDNTHLGKKNKGKKQRSTHRIPDPEEKERLQRIERTFKYL